LIWEHPWPFQFSIAIYQSNIFIPYGGGYIGILSSETGNFIGSIQLPDYHYDPNFPTRNIIQVDKKGRLYVFGKPEEYYSPIQSVFFNPGWKDNKWNKVEIPEEMTSIANPYFWGDYIVSEVFDVSTTTIVISVSSLENFTYTPIDTELPKIQTPSLFGVDNNGNAYLIVNSTPPTWIYAKYNLQTRQMQLGQIQLDTGYTIAVPSVSPDGILYLPSYSDKVLSVKPAILECKFPDR
jgi:hypothetical protein